MRVKPVAHEHNTMTKTRLEKKKTFPSEVQSDWLRESQVFHQRMLTLSHNTFMIVLDLKNLVRNKIMFLK